MKKYLAILFGGLLGAILRYFIKGIVILDYNGNLPLNTIIINVLGSFVFGIVITASLKLKKFDSNLRISITTGFIGAFTTFSTFTKEIVELMKAGQIFLSVSYCVLSIFLGLGAVGFGIYIAKKLV